MIKPAIVLVGYNRPEALKRLLKSLNEANYPSEDIELVISIDECNLSDSVEEIAREVGWKHGNMNIKRFQKRQGLRKHILQCGDLSEKYGAVIILEDDLIVSPSFYYYVYQAINQYRNNTEIAGIGLYTHSWNGYAKQPFLPQNNGFDVFWGQFSITWGQCWSAEQWKKFKKWYNECEDKLPTYNPKMPLEISHWSEQSWGKYFASYVVEQNLFYVIPYFSMTTNYTEIGQHNSIVNNAHQVAVMSGVKKDYLLPKADEAIKYDIFFERIFEDNFIINGISASDVLVNLYGTKENTFGKKYMIATANYELPIVERYGIDRRPIEENIISQNRGEGLCLYELPYNVPIKRIRMTRQMSNYYLFDFYWKDLLQEGVTRLLQALKNKARKAFRRKP